MDCFELTSFLIILSISYCDASPWVWSCDQDLKTCSRQLASQTDTPLDFLECKMTCSGEGTLWPLPTGEYSLSQTLIKLDAEDNFVIGSLTMPTEGETGYTLLVDQIVNSDFAPLSLTTDESYTLTLSDVGPYLKTATVEAETWYGLHHGMETLSQLISWNAMEGRFQMYEQASIIDSPSYPHRGISVDTSRNFMPIPVLEELISGLGQVKLNTFHWHITDSQSFPLSLTSEPRLAEYGAYYDGVVYTEDDVRGLVDYATLRGVAIVPEIDAPAHCAQGWQFGDDGAGLDKLVLCDKQDEDRCRGGVCGVLNPINPNLYDVLESVYGDMANIFPSPTFHLGGDEVKFDCWSNSSEIQDYFEENNIDGDEEDYFALWIGFLEEASARLTKANGDETKNMVIWTSSLTSRSDVAQLVPIEDYIVQVWYEMSDPSISTLINAGYRVIMSNSDAVYLDCGVGNWADEGPFYCDPYKQWRDLYDYNPREVYLQQPESDGSRVDQILGAEAAIWSEMNHADALNIRVWPRGAALAERLWTDPQGDWRDAEIRFIHQRERMSQRGVSSDGVQMLWCHQNEGRCRCTEDTC